MKNQHQEQPKKFNPVKPTEVMGILDNYMLSDGFKFTIDLAKCHDCFLYDSLNDREILDFFSFFATKAIGHNHPKMVRDYDFRNELLVAAIENPTNSDFYTTQYANFLATFSECAMPSPFKHAFFISGGTLAVENALKVAMDWKTKKNISNGISYPGNQQVIHFRQAFHGRSGYTLSLTNSKVVQTAHFSQFNWPRIDNPKLSFPLTIESLNKTEEEEKTAIAQIMKAINDHPNSICAIIIEPIQSEGGDNHFTSRFMQALRDIADEHEIMLIFDEVQTGVGITGQFWAYQHFGVVPDIIAFGKKMQTCGIIATNRVDEVADNCFTTKGRINSTWGGSLGDMVRATKILRIIKEEKLVENAAKQGAYLLKGLESLRRKTCIRNERGRGLLCAFDMPSEQLRNELKEMALSNNLLIGASGTRSIRFRPALIAGKQHVKLALEILEKSLAELEEWRKEHSWYNNQEGHSQ